MLKTAEELQQENNELESEIKLRRVLDVERKESDRKYAAKLVEIVVWGMIGLILTAFIIGILAKIWASAPTL